MLYPFLVCLLINFNVDTSIYFAPVRKINDAIAKSKNTNKLLLIDVSTSWCVPCRKMEKYAFTEPKICKIINKKFIPYKVDAEKDEGVVIARKYHVNSFPTLLVIDNQGKLIRKIIGYSTNNILYRELNHSINLSFNRNLMLNYEKDYQKGNRSKYFLHNYLLKLKESGIENYAILDSYINTQTHVELYTNENLILISNLLSTSNSKAYGILIDYLKLTHSKPINEDIYSQVVSSLSNALSNDVKDAVNNDDELFFSAILERKIEFNKLLEKMPDERVSQIRLIEKRDFYKKTKRFSQYKIVSLPYITQLINSNEKTFAKNDSINFRSYLKSIYDQPDSIRSKSFAVFLKYRKDSQAFYVAQELSNEAVMYLTYSKSNEDLIEAERFSRRATEISSFPEFLNVYAKVLFMLSKNKEAYLIKEKAKLEMKKWTIDSTRY